MRAATDVVAFEVRKTDLEPLLRARHALATDIIAKVAERKLRSQARGEAHAATRQDIDAETETLAAQLLGKVKRLFF